MLYLFRVNCSQYLSAVLRLYMLWSAVAKGWSQPKHFRRPTKLDARRKSVARSIDFAPRGFQLVRSDQGNNLISSWEEECLKVWVAWHLWTPSHTCCKVDSPCSPQFSHIWIPQVLKTNLCNYVSCYNAKKALPYVTFGCSLAWSLDEWERMHIDLPLPLLFSSRRS
jgi:hypothetical protein